MKDANCIFCKLANGDIPTNTIYEDEDFIVFMDNAPATKGHALVVPKDHFANIYEIDEEILGKAVKVGQKVAKHVTPILGCEGFNLLQNNGEVAGQTIFHFHMHLIPRYKDMENSGLLETTPNEVPAEELKDLCEQLKLNK